MAELVGAEDVAVVEGRQVVDVDLSRLEEEEEEVQDEGGDGQKTVIRAWTHFSVWDMFWLHSKCKH